MSRPRSNAAAGRRYRAKLQAERAVSATPLPAEFVSWLASAYQPKPKLQSCWETLHPFVVGALERSQIRGTDSLRKHVTHLGYFGLWATTRGLALEVDTLLVRSYVDEYCRVGMAGSSVKSRSDRRGHLRVFADQVNPDQARPRTQSIPRVSIKPPYTADEMAAVRRVITIQPTQDKARQLCVCVGLGAGAGIDSCDLKPLRRRNVIDHGQDGIEVQIPGANARIVWVLREYEDIVRRGIRDLGQDDFLLGGGPRRHNVAGAVFERAALYGDLPALEQSRLRTTWIATMMCRPVPLGLLCQAAGLKSTRTLFDLLPFLPVMPSVDIRLSGGA